jgi:hypothetical protein
VYAALVTRCVHASTARVRCVGYTLRAALSLTVSQNQQTFYLDSLTVANTTLDYTNANALARFNLSSSQLVAHLPQIALELHSMTPNGTFTRAAKIWLDSFVLTGGVNSLIGSAFVGRTEEAAVTDLIGKYANSQNVSLMVTGQKTNTQCMIQRMISNVQVLISTHTNARARALTACELTMQTNHQLKPETQVRSIWQLMISRSLLPILRR